MVSYTDREDKKRRGSLLIGSLQKQWSSRAAVCTIWRVRANLSFVSAVRLGQAA
jgi:hypothetical protein